MAVSIFPTSPADLTDEWLTNALHDAGATDRGRVISHDIKVIGEGVGFMGQLGKLNLAYDVSEPGAPASLIAKFPAAAPENRAIAMYFHFYEREVSFYRQIAERVQLRTPRCYFHGFEPATGDVLLLLEDLAPAQVGDQVAGCPTEHARLAIRELARFHSEWWEAPELYALDWMPNINVEWNIAAAEQSYAQSWAAFCEFGAGYLTPRLRETGVRFGQSMRGIAGRISIGMPQTIVHGDYRLDNMFFASPAGGAEFSVIDWQIATRGGGVFDVAYFVAGSLPEDQRGAQERELVQLYHSTLIENGITGYSMEACWDDYRRSILFMLVYSVVAAGSLDMSNPRGIDLFTKISRRTLRAVEELDADEFLE